MTFRLSHAPELIAGGGRDFKRLSARFPLTTHPVVPMRLQRATKADRLREVAVAFASKQQRGRVWFRT
jgi:hypothetical protein